jgi:two-component system, cell cycle response regulator DivK
MNSHCSLSGVNGEPAGWVFFPDTPLPYTGRERSVAPGTISPNVLLVEDDQDGRRMYAEWLTGAGYQVAQAHNGLQALDRAFASVPDIVVTDLNIPGIDGFELTRRLKQDLRTCDVPVLAVTGYAAFASDPARALRAGCDAVLPKPCSPDDLEIAIRGLIAARIRPGVKPPA